MWDMTVARRRRAHAVQFETLAVVKYLSNVAKLAAARQRCRYGNKTKYQFPSVISSNKPIYEKTEVLFP